MLAETAATRPHDELTQVVHHYLARLDPDGPEPDPTEGAVAVDRQARRRQHDRPVRPRRGRRGEGAGRAGVDRAGRPARRATPRTRAQQLGDALVQLADNALAAGNLPILRTVKPHVRRHHRLDDLVDPPPARAPPRTGFGAQISAARARWLACDGNITRIVIGPDGQPLDLGRTKRFFPPHLRRALEVRDKGCVFAGCDAPTYWCDAHHLLHWARRRRRPRSRTPPCSANGTTPRSTTASGSNDNPTADGAPTAPTAPRSSSTPTCSRAESARARSRVRGLRRPARGRTLTTGLHRRLATSLKNSPPASSDATDQP